jgi:membrane protease YdiL (CAAX protease family)
MHHSIGRPKLEPPWTKDDVAEVEEGRAELDRYHRGSPWKAISRHRTAFVPKPPAKPLYVLLRMLGWLLLATATVFLLAFIIGVVEAVSKSSVTVPHLVTALSYIYVTQIVIFWGALRRAKITSRSGHIVDGLGFYWPARWRLVIWLAILIVMLHLTGTGRPPQIAFLESAFASASFPIQGSIILLAVLVAPVAEELFYRGWLWTALRFFWRPASVMIVTSVTWLAVHMMDNIYLIPRLIPLAIILSVARHHCGSVAATIGLHMVNNAVVSAELVALYG